MSGKYKVTLRECLEAISGVCGRCGGPLTAVETEDNSGGRTLWAACPKCRHFDYGCDPAVQRAAAMLVEDHRGDIDWQFAEDDEMRKYKKREAVKSMASLVSAAVRCLKQAREELAAESAPRGGAA